jgi:hypothetical protein
MNMITELRNIIKENGTATIATKDFNKLQAEWIKRVKPNQMDIEQALSALICIVEMHSLATGNNFAWAELECAKEALDAPAVLG